LCACPRQTQNPNLLLFSRIWISDFIFCQTAWKFVRNKTFYLPKIWKSNCSSFSISLVATSHKIVKAVPAPVCPWRFYPYIF
jgi:hypothetical protein